MDNHCLTRKIFDYDYTNNKQWTTTICEIMQEIGVDHLVVSEIPVDLKWCKAVLMSNYEKTWLRCINTKPKLRTYCKWKSSFKVELYINLNLPRHHRSVLAQSRSGSLPLYIETGRYRGIKLEERICSFCNMGTVESESHFLLDCDLYNEHRIIFLSLLNLNQEMYDKDALIKLLIENSPRDLARYTYTIFMERKNWEYG